MPTAKPRITIITPCLNQAEYVERAICSVLDQGYDNLEYLVVDGGSVDGCVEIIRTYDEDLAWWDSAPDNGPADAINRALQHATGEIIAFVHADDLLLPGTLDAVAEQFSQPDPPQWVVGHCLRIGELDEQLGQVVLEPPKNLSGFLTHDAGYIPASASFFHRSVIDAYGWLDPEMRFAWSYEHHCRLIAQGIRPKVIHALVAAQREHAASTTVQNTLSAGQEYIDAAVRYADRLPAGQRQRLWQSIDERRVIYVLAAEEMAGNPARRSLWRQLLRRPWWLGNERYRKTLMRGVSHAVHTTTRTDVPLRRAA